MLQNPVFRTLQIVILTQKWRAKPNLMIMQDAN